MLGQPKSYLSPRLEARPVGNRGLYGVFAREPVAAGDLLAMWAGELVSAADLPSVPPLVRSRSIQVKDDL